MNVTPITESRKTQLEQRQEPLGQHVLCLHGGSAGCASALVAVRKALFLVGILLVGAGTARATTYKSQFRDFDSNHATYTKYVASQGTHTFIVDGVFEHTRAELYDNGTYIPPSQESKWQNGYTDPTFSRYIGSGDTIEIIVYNADNLSIWEKHRFLMDATSPTIPSLTSPNSGSYTQDRTVSLDWGNSSDSGTRVSNYQVQVDNSSSFSSPEFDATPTSSSDTTNSLSDGKYYWHVRAKDNAGNWSGWSSARSFTVDDTNPGVPSLLSPSNSSHTTDTTPTFDWSSASDGTSGIAKYQLIVETDTFGFNKINVETTSSQYTPSSSEALDAGGAGYDWRVRAMDNADNWGSWTSNRRIYIDDPTGTISVTINPASAVGDGAQWKATKSGYDTGWQDSGASPTVPVGTYTITFNTPDGWGAPSGAKPADIANVTVTTGGDETPIGTYRRIVSAYWWDPKDVIHGREVTMCARVEGFAVDDQFTFKVYEGGLNRGERGNLLVATKCGDVVHDPSDGNDYVRANWDAEWRNDLGTDPEYYFVVYRGSVSKDTKPADLKVRKAPQVTNFTSDPSGEVPYDTSAITYEVTVENESTVDRPVTVTLQADQSRGGSIDFSPSTKTYTIPSGDSHTFEFPQSDPASGAWYAKCTVTAKDNNAENQKTVDVPVDSRDWQQMFDVKQPPLGELVDFTPPPVSYEDRGETVTATIKVRNNSGATRSFWVGLSYAHESALGKEWPESWYDVYPVETDPIPAGDTGTVEIPYTLPSIMPRGSYYAVTRVWEGFDLDRYAMVGPDEHPTKSYDDSREHDGMHEPGTYAELGLGTFMLKTPSTAELGKLGTQLKNIVFSTWNDRLNIDEMLEPYDGTITKPLLFASFSADGSVPIPHFPVVEVNAGAEATVLIDLADLLFLTEEGKEEEGWVTVWLDMSGEGGLASTTPGYAVGMDLGITSHSYAQTEAAMADYRLNLEVAVEGSLGPWKKKHAWPITSIHNTGTRERETKKVLDYLGSKPISFTVSGDLDGLVTAEFSRTELLNVLNDGADSVAALAQKLGEHILQAANTRGALFRLGTYDDGSQTMVFGQNYSLDMPYIGPGTPVSLYDKRHFAHEFKVQMSAPGTFQVTLDMTGCVSGKSAYVYMNADERAELPDISRRASRDEFCEAGDTVTVKEHASEPGDYYISVITDTNFTNARLVATKVVNPIIHVQPSSLVFGHITPPNTGSKTLPLTITNDGDGTLEVQGMDSAGSDLFNFHAWTGEIESGESHQVNVTFGPGPIGDYNGTIAITSNDPDDNSLVIPCSGSIDETPTPNIVVLGRGNVIPNDDTTPSLSVGTVDIGANLVTDFTIRNNGTALLNIESASVSGDFQKTTPYPASQVDDSGDETFLSIKMDTLTVGPKKGTVTIRSNDPDDDPYTFAIEGTVDGEPDDDYDHDGFSNLQEYRNGTDPTANILVLQPGWNLVSIAEAPVDNAVADIFGAAIQGSAWIMHECRRVPVNEITPDLGHWVYCPSDTPVEIDLAALDYPEPETRNSEPGTRSSYTITLNPGWNCISLSQVPNDNRVQAILGELFRGPVWVWNGNGFERADELLPNRGHMLYYEGSQPVEIQIPRDW